MLVLALINCDGQETVIGFGGAIGADKSEAADFLAEHADSLTAPVEKHLYMAEIGVVTQYRRNGLGNALVTARIETARSQSRRFGFSHVIMRTASTGSNSARIYLGMGFKVIPDLIQIKQEHETKSTKRMYLHRQL